MIAELGLSDCEIDELLQLEEEPGLDMHVDLKPIDSMINEDYDIKAEESDSSSTSSKVESIPLAPGVVPARCGYRTGKCENLQAVKRNGKLHKLCEFHREKANMNQKKLDRKKRLRRYSPYDSPSTMTDDMHHALKNSPRSIDRYEMPYSSYEDRCAYPRPTNVYEAPMPLCREEIAIFCNLMTFDIHHHNRFMPRRYGNSHICDAVL